MRKDVFTPQERKHLKQIKRKNLIFIIKKIAKKVANKVLHKFILGGVLLMALYGVISICEFISSLDSTTLLLLAGSAVGYTVAQFYFEYKSDINKNYNRHGKGKL